MTWTDHRISELKRMHAEGYSASQIARLLGKATRNAVLGKLYRLGLCKPSKRRPKRKLSPRLKHFLAPIPVEDDPVVDRAEKVMAA